MLHCPSCSRLVPEDAVRCESCETELGDRTRPVLPETWPSRAKRYEPGNLVAGRFTIVEFVDEGGMGVVYKAIDRQVGGEVALKLLPDRLAAYEEYITRFQREVRLLRQINHPNVCRIYDSGMYDSTLYFFMEWVRGETLVDLLRHSGTLAEDRALEIAEKVARALQAAHASGVIHRDIKPSNIMIDEHGEVRVMDFGVASEVESELTRTRIQMGTPEYMSPEQRMGRKVDARSDLYSLGLVLQQMLTGDPYSPWRGRPTSLLAQLCAENPSRRFPSAAAAADAIAEVRRKPKPRGLRWPFSRKVTLWAGAAVAAIVIAIRIIIPPPPPVPDSQALYARGVQYLHDADTVPVIDDAIHMFYKSVQEDSSFAPAWAGLGEAYWTRYERTKEPQTREDAERAVARASSINKKLPEVRLAQARGLLAVRKAADAEKILRDLVDEEPKMAAAWGFLGRADGSLGKYEEGLKALHKAIDLEPENPRFHVQLGVFFQTNHEYAAAEKEFQRAIDLRHDGPTAWLNLGASYLYQNKPEKAVSALKNSLSYEPRASAYANLGTAYYYLHDYAGAAESYRQAAEMDSIEPTYPQNAGDDYRMLGKSAEADSAYVEALRRAKAFLEKTPDDQDKRNLLALLYARLNDAPDALAEADRVLKLKPDDVDALFNNAVIRVVLGQDDAAVDFLERAVHLGLGKAAILNDPDLSRLRGQPRFEKVVALAS